MDPAITQLTLALVLYVSLSDIEDEADALAIFAAYEYTRIEEEEAESSLCLWSILESQRRRTYYFGMGIIDGRGSKMKKEQQERVGVERLKNGDLRFVLSCAYDEDEIPDPLSQRANSYYETIDDSYSDRLLIQWQGKVNEFGSTLGLVKTIDLSSNNLTGQIPNEVTNLHELLVLDLSNNYLVGEIPRDIGQMTQLLTLNLSVNMFSGEIPSTMSRMTSLNYLDLSYNDLWGRIPSGTQLQTFDPSRYTGNVGLCGSPLPKKCPGDEELEGSHTVGTSEGDEEGIARWFYIGGATGFGTGFWIVCSLLLLNRRGRRAFFHFHDSLKDSAYAKVEVFIAKWRRVVRA
ncbi:leucine-rich repeat domain, L domain-like protein [Artemisia annua]|uniref:Leucine-rich repeat domain, L domain-like protein n=1 Tax=Artemisia annua TaxID=35608 RepID=A0A2U1L3N6_ARTAN|nr:leucine-rich repeat domain, L domain-like protein [Artemisia annua]